MNNDKRFRTDQSLIVTGRTVIHNGPDPAIFSVLNVEPLNGGEEGLLYYRLTRAEHSLTPVKIAPGVGVRHNVTALIVDVRPGGKPWKAIVKQLQPG